MGKPATGKKGTPTARLASRSMPPAAPAPFVRGGRLSLPDDEAPQGDDFLQINELKKRLFLQAIAQLPRIGRACRAAGITPATSWNWRQDATDLGFLQAFEVAWKLGIERAESELWRRGVEGYESPVYHQGRLVGTERVFSDTAAIFMLKGAKPETYRERFEHTGAAGGPILTQALDADALTPEQVLERIELLKRSLVEPIKLLAAAAVAQEVDKAKAAEEAYAQALAVRGNGKNGSDGGG